MDLDDMTARASTLLDRAGDDAALAFNDSFRTDWTYLPGARAGAALHDLDRAGARAALRLLAAGLRAHAYTQAVTIMAFEDVLDQSDPGGDRHRGDYWAAVFGTPGEPPWGWRIGGHHLSVHWTVAEDGAVRATPCFLGANPARVHHDGFQVLAPLSREEDLALALVEALDADQRRAAMLPGDAPDDILTGDATSVDEALEPAGVVLADLGGRAAEVAESLVAVHLDRIPAGLPQRAADDLRFAWAGGTALGEPHYYRLQGASLVVELDNTRDGANHVHCVLRDRHGDFGRDVLRTHRATAH